MKKFFSLLLATCTVFAACTDDVESCGKGTSTPLAVNVKVKPSSRAGMVHGTTLPDESSIGINVTAADDSDYDSKVTGYINVQYTADGDGNTQEWAPATDAILLSGTEGKMYAYYPWTSGIDYKAVAVNVAERTDWMYAAETYTVSDAMNTVEIGLSHAQTAVNVNLQRDASYTGAGLVEALTVTSEGLASTATLDTRDGSFTAVTGANTAISIMQSSVTLDGITKNSQENPYMLIPVSEETKNFTVTATIDGKVYSHEITMAEAFAPGKVYNVNVTFKNTGLVVSTVTLVDWDEISLGDAEFNPVVTPSGPIIDATGMPNGVYAVTSEGQLIDYNIADNTAIGIALITDMQKIMIEKYEHINDAWQNNRGVTYGLASDDYNNKSVHDTRSILPALADFEGKANTDIFISCFNQYCSDEMLWFGRGLVLNSFNGNDPQNQGYRDWYIPACGQLYEMYTYIDEINAALTRIEGTTIDTATRYWSSSEHDNNFVWVMDFNGGSLEPAVKAHVEYYLRLVHNIDAGGGYSSSKPIYAIRKGDYKLIYPANIDTNKEEYIGVTIFNGEQGYMIEKTQLYDGTYTSFYWDADKNDSSLPNLTSLDELNTYVGEGILINNNMSTWVEGSALGDWDGASNSEVIKTITGNQRNIGTILNSFNENNINNLGKNDWYIPSLGQLAYIMINSVQVNYTLMKINGSFLESTYWTSTEYNNSNAWSVTTAEPETAWVKCGSRYEDKSTNYSLLLIRDIK